MCLPRCDECERNELLGIDSLLASCGFFELYDPGPGVSSPMTSSFISRADVAPCLIKHDPGHYAVHLRRFLSADECLTLQGFDPAKVRRPQVTPLQMRQLCGNAMHCGVLRRVLEKLL